MDIGTVIKMKRKEKGLTQEELAGEIGVDVRTIRRIENRKNPGGKKTLNKLFDALGISDADKNTINYFHIKHEFLQLDKSQVLQQLGDSANELLTGLESKLYEASKLIDKEEYEEALKLYEAFAKIYNKSLIYLNCAALNHQLGQYNDSINWCEKVLEKGEYRYSALFLKATSFAELGEIDEAIKFFNETGNIKEDYTVYYNLGVLHMQKKELNQAVEYFNTSIKINTDYAAAHLNLAICYYETMQYSKVLPELDYALKLDPNCENAYIQKGQYYYFFEQHEKAIKMFEKGSLINKNNNSALLEMATSLILLNQISGAMIYLQKYLERQSKQYSELEVGKGTLIINIGYKMTRIIKIRKESEFEYSVSIAGVQLKVHFNQNHELIFIGSMLLEDKTGQMLYPTVGKVFENYEEFKRTVAKINEHVNLFQHFDSPIYIDTSKKINVYIQEKKNNVLIEIKFDNQFGIDGQTYSKQGGLESFKEQFERYGQFRIHLECNKEIFVIDCVDNVQIDTLV